MPTSEEKAAFSKRLELALRRNSESVEGATELALRFNLRHPEDQCRHKHKGVSGKAEMRRLAKKIHLNLAPLMWG